jgi:hypothetical protein
MWLDLGVENPFHVLQYEFPRVWAIWRIQFRFPSGGANSGFILGHFCIESLPDVDQDLRGKQGGSVMGYLFTIVPAVTNDFVSIPTNPGT